MSFVSDNEKSYPLDIGAEYDVTEKNQMAEFLVIQQYSTTYNKMLVQFNFIIFQIRKHFRDLKSSHCTPLPVEYFQIPWDLLHETDFVFT